MTDSENRMVKKLILNVSVIIVLLLCLGITTYALVKEAVYITDNYFHTGTIEINLNDGKPVISEHEFLFEPGMTVEKEFFIQNNSTWAVYYKIYFKNVSGGLANILEVSIKDNGKELFHGTAADLTRANVKAADDMLAVNERRNLKIYFHFPENAGNKAQGLDLNFDISADAVQTKNNPNKQFN